MTAEVRTTGLFIVGHEGDTVANVTVFLSNEQARAVEVTVAVRRVESDGTKAVVQEEAITVAPETTARLMFGDADPQGQILEITVTGDVERVLPSVSISRSQEGSPSQLDQWIAPSRFTRPRLASRRLTTGLIPVNRSGNGDSPPWIYTLDVFVSSWAPEEERMAVQVNRTLDLWAAIDSQPLLTQEQAVPAGGTARARVENIAGNTVEVNVDLSSPQLLPSVVLSRRLPNENVQQVLLWVGPSDFTPVPPNGEQV